MITRVEVDGFKSLRSFALDLEPLTAVVGANGTGKSNLFDALRLLSRLAGMTVSEAFKSERGHRRDQFSGTGEEAAHRMSFAAELLLMAPRAKALGHTRVRYEVELAREEQPSGVEILSVVRERVVPIRHADDAWGARHPQLAPFLHYGEDANVSEWLDETTSPFAQAHRVVLATRLLEGLAEQDRSALALPSLMAPAIVLAVGEELRSFQFLHLDPSKLRLPSERAAAANLEVDGSNLPTALAALSREARVQIRADLARHIPGFRAFEVVPVDDELRLEFEFTDGQRATGRVLSDGMLRLLAIYTLLRAARPGTTIALEEPENGIHPGLLRDLVEDFAEAATPDGEPPVQVLLNSQSPAVVAAFQGRLDSLAIADLVRRGGGPRTTRMRHVWRPGDPEDRGATTFSRKEVERILETARFVDEVAAE